MVCVDMEANSANTVETLGDDAGGECEEGEGVDECELWESVEQFCRFSISVD